MKEYILFYFLYITSYFGSSYLCYLWDFFGAEKRHPTTKQKLIQLYKKILPVVIFNVCIVSPFSALYLFSFFTLTHTTNLYTIPIDLFFMIMGTEILFYILHRIAHIPVIYKYVHKRHHELIEPIGLGALYCSPLEMIFVNIPPILLPGLLLGISFNMIILFSILTTFNTVINGHGGYKNNGIAFHDKHHERFNGNYGIGYFMDKIFNTIIN